MKNKLIDVSIVTMIGNLPTILNRNNKYVSEEFDTIRTEDNKMVLDVSTASVTAGTGIFNNVNVTNVNATQGKFTDIKVGDVPVGNKIQELERRISALESALRALSSN